MGDARKVTVDLDLLRKHATARPPSSRVRTAPHFHSGFDAKAFRDEIVAVNSEEGAPDLSIYCHLPFCPSLCAFCGCSVLVTDAAARIQGYLDDLKREVDLLADLTRPGRRVVQVQWGGGTPTMLSPAQIRDTFAHLRSRFAVDADADCGVEVDPRRLDADRLAALREAGFGCVTFGVQDLDPRVQQAVNRVQPEADTRRVVQESRVLGFDTIAVDLIFGLPFQDTASFTRTLEAVADISPDRITVFGYGHIPQLKPHQRALERYPIPDVEERLRLLQATIETLTGAGYVHLGLEHFARPGDALARALDAGVLCRNFQGFCASDRTDVHGIGLTAISQLQGAFAQNTKGAEAYAGAVREGRLATAVGCRLAEDDRQRAAVVRDVLCSRPILKREVEVRLGADFDVYFSGAIEPLGALEADGLVELSADSIRVTGKGRLFLRQVAAAFCRPLRG